jgi:adenylate cyclase
MKNALQIAWLRFAREWPVMLAISLLATGLGYVWWSLDLFSIGDDERSAYDDGVKQFTGKEWFPWGKVHQSDDVVIIAIDDKTFADVSANEAWRTRYGAWPYDRVIYADIFEYLHQAGAKSIAFDATIDEPKADPTGDLALGEVVRQNGIPFYLGFNVTPTAQPLPKVEPVNHPPLKAVAPAPKPAAQPAGEDQAAADDQEEFPSDDAAFEEPEQKTPEQLAAEAKAKADALRAKAAGLYAFPVEARGGLELQQIEPVEEHDARGEPTGRTLPRWPVPAIEPVLDSVSGFGLVLLEEDGDGKMRRTHFAYSDGVNTYVTLPVAMAADLLGADKLIVEPGKLTLGTRVIPIDQDGGAWIDYGGTLATRFRSVSLVDVLRLKERGEGRELFAGKHVFVAGFALGTGDVKTTPLEQSTPGVVKQAAVFEDLMHGGFITDAPMWASLLLSLLVCFLSVALVLVIRNGFVDIGWPVLLYFGFFMVTGSFLVMTRTHVLSAMPGLAGTLASVMATTWERLFSSKDRERLKDLFRAYMSEMRVSLLVEQKHLPRLDGENQHVTAVFSGIDGFAALSEKLEAEPKRLLRLLNRYLSVVTPAFTGQGACIDKFVGDTVIALFGSPLPQPDHPLRACRSALEVQKTVEALRAPLEAEGLPALHAHIGLCTDTMLIGNIGSDELLDFTAIGEGMRSAGRLQALNKSYGTTILLSEATRREAGEEIVVREIDWVRVGEAAAHPIFELVGMCDEVGEPKLKLIALYEQALAKYRVRCFEEALALLEQALALDAADGPSLALKQRAAANLKEAPSESWDGAVKLTA